MQPVSLIHPSIIYMFKCSLVSPELSNLFLQLTTVAGQQGPLSNGCKHQTFEETEIYVKVIRIRLLQSARGQERGGRTHKFCPRESADTPRTLESFCRSRRRNNSTKVRVTPPPPGTRAAYALTVCNSH